VNRSVSGRRGRSGRRPGYGSPSMIRRRPPRRREGFGFFGPFPSYSRRSRRGSQVTVGGCCLPIPLALTLSAAAAARALTRQ
jgi:hypothetical protein